METMNRVFVKGGKKFLNTYEIKKWLCFSYTVLVKSECLGNFIYIKTGNEPISKVYLDGETIYKAK